MTTAFGKIANMECPQDLPLKVSWSYQLVTFTKKISTFSAFCTTSVLSRILQDFKALCGAEVFPDLPAEQIVVIFNGLECKEDQKVNYTSKVNMVIKNYVSITYGLYIQMM